MYKYTFLVNYKLHHTKNTYMFCLSSSTSLRSTYTNNKAAMPKICFGIFIFNSWYKKIGFFSPLCLLSIDELRTKLEDCNIYHVLNCNFQFVYFFYFE